MIADSRRVTCGRARLCGVYGAGAEASEQGVLEAFNSVTQNDKIIDAAGTEIWLSGLSGAMLVMEGAGGLSIMFIE